MGEYIQNAPHDPENADGISWARDLCTPAIIIVGIVAVLILCAFLFLTARDPAQGPPWKHYTTAGATVACMGGSVAFGALALFNLDDLSVNNDGDVGDVGVYVVVAACALLVGMICLCMHLSHRFGWKFVGGRTVAAVLGVTALAGVGFGT